MMPASGRLPETKYSASEFGQMAFEFHEVTHLAKGELSLYCLASWETRITDGILSKQHLLGSCCCSGSWERNRDGRKQDVSYKGKKS